MSSKEPDPTPPKAGGLWARLFGMGESPKSETPAPPKHESEPLKPESTAEERSPEWPAVPAEPPAAAMSAAPEMAVLTEPPPANAAALDEVFHNLAANHPTTEPEVDLPPMPPDP